MMSVGLDKTVFLQPGKMLGYLYLGAIQDFLKVANAERPLGQ